MVHRWFTRYSLRFSPGFRLSVAVLGVVFGAEAVIMLLIPESLSPWLSAFILTGTLTSVAALFWWWLHRGQTDLARTNTALQQEIAERRRVEKALQNAHDGLERQIYERTADLIALNEQLQTEITKHKQTGLALQASEGRLRIMVGQIPAILWTTDCDLHYTFMQGMGLSLIDILPDWMVGQTVQDFFHTEEATHPVVAAHLRAVAGESVTYERTWRKHTFQSYVEPLRGPDGDITGCIGVSIDITERKQAEETLKREHDVTETMTAIRLAIAIMDQPEAFVTVLRQMGNHLTRLGLAEPRHHSIQVVNSDEDDFISFDIAIAGEQDWRQFQAICEQGLSWPRQSSNAEDYPWVIETWKTGQLHYDPCTPEDGVLYAGFSKLDVSFSHGTLAINRDRPHAINDEDIALLQRFAEVLSEGFRRFLDLIEYRRAETALRQSEQQYRDMYTAAQRQTYELMLLDQIQDIIINELNLSAMLKLVVEDIVRTFEYSRGGIYLLNGDMLELQHSAGYQPTIEKISINAGVNGRVARTGEPALIRDTHTDIDFIGSCEDFTSEVCVPLRDEVRIVGTLDVESVGGAALTEMDLRLIQTIGEQVGMGIGRIRLYAEARENEGRLRLALEAAKMGTWDWDVVHNRIKRSAYAQRLYGIDPDAQNGSIDDILLRIHPEDRKRVNTTASQGIAEALDDVMEYRIIWPDGSVHWLAENGQGYRNDAGQLVRILGVVQDITEQKQLEAALAEERRNLEKTVEMRTQELHNSLTKLEETNLRLQAANRHRTRFLSSMSHELRTPLNAILGFNDLLKGQFFGPLNDKQNTYTEQIDVSGRHLLALITDLLDITKIDAGVMELERAEFAHNDLIDGMVAMMQNQIRRKGLTVGTAIDPSLPLITGDLRKCKQIMLNLLSNAVKFTPEGGRIEIRAERTEDLVTITVSDTGVGIAPEEQEHIFSEFYQADRVRDEALGGTGIGLALTRRLVALHGGEIGVDSAPGKGSAFWFTLPQPLALKKARPADEAPMPAPATVEPVTERRILVVDDNEANLRMLRNLLSIHRHSVMTATTGQEAIAAAPTFKPDFIVMDIQMPKMDGLEATRRLRAMPAFATTPILALTANVTEEDRACCLAAGCTAYLVKPFVSQDLFDLLARYLGKRTSAS